ncbi:MAG: hypothetical protein JJT81_09480 [Rubellimicrobium sp.]|jgi:hypothetical protein|nr:hypothetical protein [Rubellimicrobium sp.]
MAEYYPFLFPIGSGLLAGLGLYLVARAGQRGLAIAVVGLLALGTVVTLVRAGRMEGMDGLAITLIAVLFLAPAALGGTIGALIGDWQGRHRVVRGDDDA